MGKKVNKTEAEWRTILDKETFSITRKAGTERAFTGKYHDYKGSGSFVCQCCGEPLFDAAAKYDSGTGWPSFWEPVSQDAVAYRQDNSWGRRRTEVICSSCDAHLGHSFPDGPKPSGIRYCINSAALALKEKES